MTNKNIFMLTIIAVGIIVSLGFILFWDYIPPRTAHKVARIHSDLDIKSDFKVNYFSEKYSFTGDGLIEIKFELTEKQKYILLDNLDMSEFKVINDNSEELIIEKSRLNKIRGFYKYEEAKATSLNKKLIVIDTLNSVLIYNIIIR